MRQSVEGTLDSAVATLLNQPTFWGITVVAALFFYLWRKDVSNPQKTASAAVLSGAVEHSTSVYETANQALAASLRCERRFNALIEYTRTLQSELVKHGHTVPPMPEDALD